MTPGDISSPVLLFFAEETERKKDEINKMMKKKDEYRKGHDKEKIKSEKNERKRE